MATNTLNISLSIDDIKHIQKLGMNILISKSTKSEFETTWICLDKPRLLETTTIKWENEYALSAEQQEIQNGAVIKTSSKLFNDPVFGNYYDFDNYFHKDEPKPLDDKAAVGVKIINPLPHWSVALYQNVDVEGQKQYSPVGVSNASTNITVVFTPLETIYVYLGKYSANTAVKISAEGEKLELTYKAGETFKIAFNRSTNTFSKITQHTLADSHVSLLTADNDIDPFWTAVLGVAGLCTLALIRYFLRYRAFNRALEDKDLEYALIADDEMKFRRRRPGTLAEMPVEGGNESLEKMFTDAVNIGWRSLVKDPEAQKIAGGKVPETYTGRITFKKP